MSKGSSRRPEQVPAERVKQNWDAIFSKCKRCGKRISDDGIHTCSPQKDKEK